MLAERLADEVPWAQASVLDAAYGHSLATERSLELEAPSDPAIRELFERARLLRHDIATAASRIRP